MDEQISQIDSLSAIINSAEKEMLRLRKAYQGAVEARDAMGVTLIDRSDEIAILYEKANVLVSAAISSILLISGPVHELRLVLDSKRSDVDRAHRDFRPRIRRFASLGNDQIQRRKIQGRTESQA